MRTEAKAELPLPVYACKNTYVLRAIDTYIQAVQANPRFTSSIQGKNATGWKFSYSKLKMHVSKVETACGNETLSSLRPLCSTAVPHAHPMKGKRTFFSKKRTFASLAFNILGTKWKPFLNWEEKEKRLGEKISFFHQSCAKKNLPIS